MIVSFLEQNWFAISLLGTLITFVVKVTIALDSFKQDTEARDEELRVSLDDFKEEVKNHFMQVDEKFKELEDKREDEKERTRIIMTGVEATLISLHNDGHNGPVTASLKEIADYKARKSAE